MWIMQFGAVIKNRQINIRLYGDALPGAVGYRASFEVAAPLPHP